MGLELFADRIELPRESRNSVLEDHVRHYASALETQVAKAPLQWFNFYDFWNSDECASRTGTRADGHE
jgi:predicted LPLAT superfamily acyltransferase